MVWNKIITYILLYLCTYSNCANFQKVSTDVQKKLNDGQKPDVIVECPPSQSKETSDLFDGILKQISEKKQNPATARLDLVTNLYQQLQDTVIDFFKDLLNLLKKLNVKGFKLLWISYEISIPSATPELISELVKLDIVKIIRSDRQIPRNPPQPPGSQPAPEGNKTWNIGLIDARCKQIEKNYGKGVIVAVLDGGALVTHEDIQDNWLGHDAPFGYFDGFGQDCKPYPDAHGTFVVDMACGKNYGVANESRWMMCRICDEISCPESSIKTCMQWASCPYQCNDTSPETPTKDCSHAPHVINNSWGVNLVGTAEEVQYTFYDYVKHWNDLGIISIFAAGNSGRGCITLEFPATYDITVAVGAVDVNVVLGTFSSVGPAVSTRPLNSNSTSAGTCSFNSCGSQKTTCELIKPDIVAPGVGLEGASTINNTATVNGSGTSYAAPHVTGVVALMISANPKANWNYKKAYKILTGTADTSRIDLLGERQNKNDPAIIQTNLWCNKMISNICNTYPNNMYGYGVVNACKAVEEAKKLKH